MCQECTRVYRNERLIHIQSEGVRPGIKKGERSYQRTKVFNLEKANEEDPVAF